MATTLKRPPSPVAPANPESHLSPITPADHKTRGKQLRDPYRVPGGRMRVARTPSAFFAPRMRPGSQNWCPTGDGDPRPGVRRRPPVEFRRLTGPGINSLHSKLHLA
jgi:hypothetical protein